MILREQLREIHDADLPLHILEQDYIHAIFLKELYKKTEKLAFKGGTFLKHAYGLDRFSEDLGFSVYQTTNYQTALKEASHHLADYGIEAKLSNITTKNKSTTATLRYKGPLFNGTNKSIGSIHLELSNRNDIFLEPSWIRLFFKYPEVRIINVLGLQKEELFAEKLRALSTRNKSRDLYDIWFLIKQNIPIHKELFIKKMKAINTKPIVTITTSKSEWKQDLEVLLMKPPEYEKVKNNVITTLSQHGFNIK